MYISIRMWNALSVDISRFLFSGEALAFVVTYAFLNVLTVVQNIVYQHGAVRFRLYVCFWLLHLLILDFIPTAV